MRAYLLKCATSRYANFDYESDFPCLQSYVVDSEIHSILGDKYASLLSRVETLKEKELRKLEQFRISTSKISRERLRKINVGIIQRKRG